MTTENAGTITTTTSIASNAAGAQLTDLDDVFVFPGSVITDDATVSTITAVAIDGANQHDLTINGALGAAADNLALRNAKEFYAALPGGTSPDGDIFYHIVHGSDTTANVSAASATLLAPTNFATATEYDVGPSVANATTSTEYANNVLLASQLTKSSNTYTLKILPLVNKYDALRDVISVRAEGSVSSLTSTLISGGLKLIASVSGNNLSGTTDLTLFEVLAPGSFSSTATVRTLPASGTASRLLAHKDGEPTTDRADVDPSSLVTTATDRDTLDEAIVSQLSTTSILDTTLPPLFTGGSVGNTESNTAAARRGPVPHIQAKGRVIAIEESSTTSKEFAAIEDLGSNTRIRITFPTGIDINNYSGTAADIFDVFSTTGVTAAIANADVYTVGRDGSDNIISNAFIDIAVSAVSADDIQRGIYVGLKPHALVVTDNVTDPTVTITVSNNAGTQNSGSTTDDQELGSIGTTSLGTISKFLNVAFASQASSDFQVAGSGDTTVRSVFEATQGSISTSFPSTVTEIVRFVNNSTSATNLVDLTVSEVVADAIPLGGVTDGVTDDPFASGVIQDSLQLRCATTSATTSDAGFVDIANVAAPTDANVLASDDSITW